MKRIYILVSEIMAFVICVVGFLFINVDTLHANTINNNIVFNNEEYFSHFYSGQEKILVTDENGLDVTDYFLDKTMNLFLSNNIEDIKSIMVVEGLRTHIFKEEFSLKSPYALEQSKTVSDYIYDYYEEPQYRTVMEFACILKGTIWYNPNTYAVTRTSTPVFNVTVMNVPLKIVPSCNSISTGSRVEKGKGYFWAKFTVTGVGYDSGIPVTKYNYGTHTVSFYGTP